MKKKQRVTYSLAVHGAEEFKAVADVLNRHETIMGKRVKRFEETIAALFAKKYGVMVNSGTSANFIAIKLLSLPAGSEVITPVLTFATTVAPLVQNNLIPVFVDAVMGTYQIDTNQVEQMVTKKTRALMVPSLIGNLPDFSRLRAIAKKYHLIFIEDSCDTLGATFNGRRTGSYSDISTTSFYGSHIITAAGSGGMVAFNNKAWDRRARILRGWGRTSAISETESIGARFRYRLDGKFYDAKFIFEELGYNFLPSEIDAAFGLAQVKKLRRFSRTRKHNMRVLRTFFQRYPDLFIIPEELPGTETNWLAFPLTLTKDAPFTRHEIVMYLERNNVQTRPVFSGNILKHPGFRTIPHKKRKGGYPVADYVMGNSFLIGCHHGLTDKHLDLLKERFQSFLEKRRIYPRL